ncbi:protein SRG1-like [Olea europaea var. sylvestris]|uniref:protein SRG1-like n=1 Tax=Olea europaea var. sylvestris TaxID=158386 RepID=UPI000C1CDA83|nr:protein SRG1-like [Olea europaea var. sylvestris]
MEPKLKKLGSSLEVPNVQELAKEKLTTVPARYLRPNQDHLISSSPGNQIPVIDMQILTEKDSEIEKLHTACQEWGFFQLINHGVSSSKVEKMKSELQEFFNLPIEEKKKFSQEAGDVQGYGQAFVLSEEQKLDWADMFYVITSPIELRKPHIIPKLPAKFRDSIDEYTAELRNLAMKILNLMAKALHMKAEEMNKVFEEGMQAMRMNYYPPCPQPELVTGLCPHSDAIALTILLQVNEIEGLQIKKDGAWIPVVPLPNAFIINIGDILEIVTNGIYQSVEHRATVNSKKERLSVATFFYPNVDCDLIPAPSLVTPETPAKFKRISLTDYVKGFISRELDGKSYLDIMRI